MPFTPHNSFVDSTLPRFTNNDAFDASLLQDKLEGIQTVVPSSGKIMTVVSEKLSTKSLDSVLDNTVKTAVTINSGDDTGNPTSMPFAQKTFTLQSSELETLDLESSTENVVARNLAREMVNDSLNRSTSEFSDAQNDDSDEKGPSGGNHGNQPGPNQSHNHGSKNSDSKNGTENMSDSQNSSTGNPSQNIEDAMFSLAGEIIQDALESFPDERSPVIKEALNRWSLDELVDTRSNGDDISIHQPVTTDVNNLKKDLHKTPSSSSLTIETDYLPKVDPYHGNLNILGDSVEVVENTSFRKMSQEAVDLEVNEVLQKYGKNKEEANENQQGIFVNFAEHVAEDVLTSAIDTAACQKAQVLCSPESDTTETSDFSSTTTTEGSYRVNDSVLSSPDNIPEFPLDSTQDGDNKSKMEITENDLLQEETFKSVENQDTQMVPQISISNESLSSCTGAHTDIPGLEINTTSKSLSQNKEKKRKESWDKSHDTYSFNSVNTTTILSESNMDSSLKEDSSKTENLLGVKNKEVYQTTAGRISLPSDSAGELESPRTQGSEVKFSSGSHDPILEESKTQVGKMIARADNLIAQVDATLAFLNADDPCMDVFTENSDESQKPPANMTRRKHPSSSSTDGKEKFKEIEFTEEWQDDDIPGMPQEEEDSTDSSDDDDDDASTCSDDSTKNKPNDTPITTPSQPIPEFTAEEEYKEAKHWRGVEVGGKQRKIDLRVIEPYKKVLSHGGLLI
ncbi:hypothetical protein KUTeg_010713 [Tegillarca granosa]|uniref:Uncharacterized protein n=1 Tax=Tegillarca granosa TaxID=220873 RepID=A0ABQ9F1T3_TEGGR|nr:hypothetical protein KUTeg_010713 [Tegillarca granosa]